MKKGIRLYNVIFLPWMLYDLLWLFSFLGFWQGRLLVLAFLAGNFAIDSLVLCLAMKRRKLQGKKQIWRKSIWKIWGIGYLSDCIGMIPLQILDYLFRVTLRTRFQIYLEVSTIGWVFMALPGIVLAGVLIYLLNKRFSFAKCDLDPAEVRRLSLALAIFTAPYLMLIGY